MCMEGGNQCSYKARMIVNSSIHCVCVRSSVQVNIECSCRTDRWLYILRVKLVRSSISKSKLLIASELQARGELRSAMYIVSLAWFDGDRLPERLALLVAAWAQFDLLGCARNTCRSICDGHWPAACKLRKVHGLDLQSSICKSYLQNPRMYQ